MSILPPRPLQSHGKDGRATDIHNSVNATEERFSWISGSCGRNTPTSENWERHQGQDASWKMVLGLTSNWSGKGPWKFGRSVWNISLRPAPLELSVRKKEEIGVKKGAKAGAWVALKGAFALLKPRTDSYLQVSRCVTRKKSPEKLVILEESLDILGNVRRWESPSFLFFTLPPISVPFWNLMSFKFPSHLILPGQEIMSTKPQLTALHPVKINGHTFIYFLNLLGVFRTQHFLWSGDKKHFWPVRGLNPRPWRY